MPKEKNIISSTNNKENQSSKGVQTIDAIIKWGVYILAGLLPVFFLPFTSELLEINKQLVLVVFSGALFLLWIGKMLLQSEVKFVRSPLNTAILIYLLVHLAASIFSQDKFQSFLGSGVAIAESFLTTLAFVLLYFVIINNLTSLRVIRNVVLIMLGAMFLLGAWIIFQSLEIYLLPLAAVKFPSFNPIGTVNALEIFIALGIIFSVLSLIHPESGRPQKIIAAVLGLFLLTVCFLLGFKNIWVGLAVTLVFVLGFSLARREPALANWLFVPMILLGLLIIFYFIPFPAILKNIPGEILPSPRAGLDIAMKSLKNDLVVGSGPGTWVADYAKYKIETINLSELWSIRFAKGWSKISMMPATMGLLGVVSWLAVIGVFLFLIFKNLLSSAKNLLTSKGVLSFALASGWFYLVFMQFTYNTNLTLEFVFWLTMGLFVATRFIGSDTKARISADEARIKGLTKGLRIPFDPTSPLASIISFVFILTVVISIVGFYFLGQYYAADVIYNKGLRVFSKEGDLAKSITLFNKAASLNQQRDLYYRTLAQVYFRDIQEKISQLKPADQFKAQEIRVLVDRMLKIIGQSTELAPYNVENWIQRAVFYHNLMGIGIEGAREWAVNSFEKSIALEPANPYLYTELARVYSTGADSDQSQKEEFLMKAEENLGRAIQLKLDYAPAHLLLANVYDRQDRIDEAITRLEALRNLAINDAGLAFQLGYLYYRQNQFTLAQGEFERAVALIDNFSNARYFLGLIYDRQDRRGEAMEQFQKISALNPSNQEVLMILANLRSGRNALEGLAASSVARPPIAPAKPETEPSEPGL